MTYKVPDDSHMSSVGLFWAAWVQAWRLPIVLMTLGWNTAEMLWLPAGHAPHAHGEHDQLTIPEPLDVEAAPALFA